MSTSSHDQVGLDVAADLTFCSLLDEDARVQGQDSRLRRRVLRAGLQAAAIVACFGAVATDPGIC